MPADIASLEAAFSEALDIPRGPDRDAYLERACAGDAELRRQVVSLLALNERAGRFLDAPTVSHAPGTAEPAGAMIGPYKLLEPIGEGGMGTVYMAEQAHPVRRKVALKVIKPGMDSKQVVARFEAERQALALMDHPNIARVLDAGATDSGLPYFVMELVRGVPITEYCDRAKLPIRERLELFALVCRAVQHAHQKGVIHRDIKPTNVLVTLHDGVPVPKVIDFGIAKATGQSLTDKTLFTGFAQLVGTPLYMSPEQAEMSGLDVDTRSDIYSLGVLLYELLTGTTPFDRETFGKAAFDEVRRIIREEEPPKPSTRLSALGDALTTVSARRGSDPRHLDRSVRGELDWIAMKALEKDRRRRYETANDLAADVMRYLTDQAVEACPPTARYRLGKLARRHRAALSTATLVAVALVGGAGASTWQAVRAVRAERSTASALAEARRAVDEMYTQVAEKWLANQATLTPLQREFLEKALAFYQGFASRSGADPHAEAQAALAAIRVGRIRQSLGQNVEAEAAYRRAVGQATALRDRHPDRPESRGALAAARGSLAALLWQTGRLKEAEQGLRAAIEGWTEPSAGGLATAADRAGLAEAHEQLSRILEETDRPGEAEAALRAAVGSWETLAGDPKAADEHRLGLARARALLGRLLDGFLGRPDEAEKVLRSSLDLLATLEAGHRDEKGYRVALSLALRALGIALLHLGRNRESEEAYRRALPLQEGLVADFPEVPEYREKHASLLNNLGNTVGLLDRAGEKEELLRRAIAIEEDLVGRHPDVPNYRDELARTEWNLIFLLRARGEHAEARRHLERMIAQEKANVAINPRNGNYQAILLGHSAHLQDLLLEIGDHAAAARAAEECAGLEATHNAPDGKKLTWELACSLVRCITLAEHDAGLAPGRRREAARDYARRARAVLVEGARRWKGYDNIEGYLSLLVSTAPWPEVRDADLGLRLARGVVARNPGDDGGRWTLGWALYRAGDWKGCVEALEAVKKEPEKGGFFLAMAYWRLGDEARARALFDRTDAWLPGYEARAREADKRDVVYWPDPAFLRFVRAEAAALLGVTAPDAVAAPR